jgi:hypothetical protein
VHWRRLCSYVPCLQGPMFFDMERGTYRSLSDRAYSTLHGVRGAMGGSVAGFASLLSLGPTSPGGRRGKNSGRNPLL